MWRFFTICFCDRINGRKFSENVIGYPGEFDCKLFSSSQSRIRWGCGYEWMFWMVQQFWREKNLSSFTRHKVLLCYFWHLWSSKYLKSNGNTRNYIQHQNDVWLTTSIFPQKIQGLKMFVPQTTKWFFFLIKPKRGKCCRSFLFIWIRFEFNIIWNKNTILNSARWNFILIDSLHVCLWQLNILDENCRKIYQ